MKPPRRSLRLVTDDPSAIDAHCQRLVEAGYVVDIGDGDDNGGGTPPVIALVAASDPDALARAVAAGADAAVMRTDEPADLLEEIELLDL